MPESIHGKLTDMLMRGLFPEQMNGNKEYTLVIELKSQRSNYVSFIYFRFRLRACLCGNKKINTELGK